MEKLLSERNEYEATRNIKHLKKYFDQGDLTTGFIFKRGRLKLRRGECYRTN